MAKPKPFFGTIIVGQVLLDGFTLDWNNELEIKGTLDTFKKIKTAIFPKVNYEKWIKSISKIEIVNETNAKNVKDSIIRGTVGGVALGGVGALAGVMSAKSDSTFNVMITYRNNKIDLIECDIKLYTKLLQQANENNEQGLTEYEDVYYTEEERRKMDEEDGKKYEGSAWLGCLVIIGIGAFIVWFLWFIFFMEI